MFVSFGRPYIAVPVLFYSSPTVEDYRGGLKGSKDDQSRECMVRADKGPRLAEQCIVTYTIHVSRTSVGTFAKSRRLCVNLTFRESLNSVTTVRATVNSEKP
ncbi:hypothetical protein J6590_010783 [Homalodisca vitripennis]|nr:hypothetical protein J6590_010783 [Homalodisca vitripennis]